MTYTSTEVITYSSYDSNHTTHHCIIDLQEYPQKIDLKPVHPYTDSLASVGSRFLANGWNTAVADITRYPNKVDVDHPSPFKEVIVPDRSRAFSVANLHGDFPWVLFYQQGPGSEIPSLFPRCIPSF